VKKLDETQFRIKNSAFFGIQNGAFLSFTPPSPSSEGYSTAGFFNLTQFWTKLRVLVLCFPDFTEIYLEGFLGPFRGFFLKIILLHGEIGI
jgi:hypothetical protein